MLFGYSIEIPHMIIMLGKYLIYNPVLHIYLISSTQKHQFLHCITSLLLISWREFNLLKYFC
jgi:hypothetical protein